MPSLTHITNIVIPVADQDTALAFYTEKLGCELRVDTPFGEGMRWIEVAPAGATTTIALAPPPPGSTDIGSNGTGITFATEDIEATHAELSAAGVDVDAEIMRMGGPVPPMFWFRDPEQNVLLVVGEADEA